MLHPADILLKPRSVAVIGASADATRIGGRPIDYMRRWGFEGAIFPVNPNRSEIQGLTCYPSVEALPEAPDVAIVAVPADAAQAAVEALGQRGTKAVVVFTAGFAEVGGDGIAAQARLVATARAAGMRLLGPNSLGLFNARVGFYATFTASLEGGLPTPGRVGIVSQSGAYGSHLFAIARNRRIGTPLCVTTGNEADITVGEVLDWMVHDGDTDVIALYAEGIRDGASFIAGLEAARRARKPVVVMKVGRSRVGRAAAQSHTASIAGDDAVTEAILAEFGAVRARSTEEMLDIVKLATQRVYPVGNTLGVITVSGGAGVLISDVAETLGLPMPPMPEAAQVELKALLPYATPTNPVDCTAQALNDIQLAGRFMEITVARGGYGSVLAFFTQTGGAPTIAPRLRAELVKVRENYPDRLYVLSVIASEEQVAGYEADGFAVLEDPTRATVAIHAMGLFGEAFARAATPASAVEAPPDLPATNPDEAEAKLILERAGVNTVPERACTSAEAAVAAADAFGYPVVLKILSPDIIHKSEIGGVLLDIADAAAVTAGFETVMRRATQAAPGARLSGVLVAKQLRGGVECILGINHDPVFGPVAVFGLGGIFVEVLRDVVFRRCPFNTEVADTMIRSVRGAPLLLGARGRPAADIPALAKALSRLSHFAHAAGSRLRSAEINPMFAMPDKQGAFAADAVIELDVAAS